jgi:DNA modification methylase/uncharacterized ParB-like nuclease family protein
MPFANPDNIVVEERFRETLPELDQLTEDIKAVGQLQPILVREESGQLILIAGQRRLEACKKLGRQVWWVSQKSAQGTLDINSPLQLKRMELMENLSRCSFTPIEEAKAIAQIDAIMKQLYGEKKPGPVAANEATGWNYDQTAAMLGFSSKGTVSRAVRVAELADAVPDINEAVSITEAEKILVREIQKAARAELLRRSETRTVTVGKEQEETSATAMPPQLTIQETVAKKILTGDAVALCKNLAADSIDIIIADPPYELDAFSRMVKGHYAAGTAKFDDGENAVDFSQLLPEFARILNNKGWLFLFGSLEQFLVNREALTQLGLTVFEVPLIWVKGSDLTSINPSYNPSPFAWPATASEHILMAKKGNPSVVKHRHNVIPVAKVPAAEKSHSSQKPVELLTYLIEWVHVSLYSATILDPFCGSASTLIAASRRENLDYLGFEKDPAIASNARSNLVNELLRQQTVQ